ARVAPRLGLFEAPDAVAVGRVDLAADHERGGREFATRQLQAGLETTRFGVEDVQLLTGHRIDALVARLRILRQAPAERGAPEDGAIGNSNRVQVAVAPIVIRDAVSYR